MRYVLLRRPSPLCVNEVADSGDARRYVLICLYVEEGKKLRSCPAPGCDHIVEFLDGEQRPEQLETSCSCGHGFFLRYVQTGEGE